MIEYRKITVISLVIHTTLMYQKTDIYGAHTIPIHRYLWYDDNDEFNERRTNAIYQQYFRYVDPSV